MSIEVFRFFDNSCPTGTLLPVFAICQRHFSKWTAVLPLVFVIALQPIGSVHGESLETEYAWAPSSDGLTRLSDSDEPRGPLSLPKAISLALSYNPSLAAFTREIRARDGAVQQAGLPPNPVFDASAQNFGNSVLRGFDGKSLTLSLSQTILLGGKLAKATRVAELDRDLAVWDYESRRMDLLTEVFLDYIDVVTAQQVLQLANDLSGLADRMVEAVSARVRAGAASPVDETRARVSWASVQIEQQKAQRELVAARKRLAATWGGTDPKFEYAHGKLEPVRPIPSLSFLKDHLVQNPDLARWTSEIGQRQASIELAESRAIPDLTVNLGVQQYLNNGDNTLGTGISIPLPIFDRNQGGVVQAHQRFNKGLEERRNVQILVATALNEAYQRLSAEYAEVGILEKTVLPGAESAFKAIEKGYRRGKFNLLDVLLAQRTFFDAKIQHLRALAGYHQSKIRIERLTGELPVAP